VWIVSVSLRPLYLEKGPGPIIQKAVWDTRPVQISAENFSPPGFQTSNRPAPIESLYRLRNPGPQIRDLCIIIIIIIIIIILLMFVMNSVYKNVYKVSPITFRGAKIYTDYILGITD
jgi:hypothetical protein